MSLRIRQTGNEFRFELIGDFTDLMVVRLAELWKDAQSECWKDISVDLSGVTACSPAGEQTLSELLKHGTRMSARTPNSLDLLKRLSAGHKRLSRVDVAEQFSSSLGALSKRLQSSRAAKAASSNSEAVAPVVTLDSKIPAA